MTKKKGTEAEKEKKGESKSKKKSTKESKEKKSKTKSIKKEKGDKDPIVIDSSDPEVEIVEQFPANEVPEPTQQDISNMQTESQTKIRRPPSISKTRIFQQKPISEERFLTNFELWQLIQRDRGKEFELKPNEISSVENKRTWIGIRQLEYHVLCFPF